jgi:pyruvate/2-oxoglutarate/acetoin dehydrogenase E1 component
MTGGAVTAAMVIRTRVGDGPYGGHPQDYTSWFCHIPGLKVVMPAAPADAKGLMTAAIRYNGPVLFVEPMSLSHASRETVDLEPYEVPIGSARVMLPGSDVTVVAIGSMVPVAMRSASDLRADGIAVEVIDLRSLQPWDRDTVIASVRRTHRLVTVEETWTSLGMGAEIVATVVERIPFHGLAAVARVGSEPVPIPSGPLRKWALPNDISLIEAIRTVARTSTG